MLLDRVKMLAKNRGITIAELERKLDFSQGSISRWIKQSPSSERVQKVADYFDVSVDYLLGRSENMNNTDMIISIEYTQKTWNETQSLLMFIRMNNFE